MKKVYEQATLLVTLFEKNDVVTASNERGTSWLSNWNNWGDDWANKLG